MSRKDAHAFAASLAATLMVSTVVFQARDGTFGAGPVDVIDEDKVQVVPGSDPFAKAHGFEDGPSGETVMLSDHTQDNDAPPPPDNPHAADGIPKTVPPLPRENQRARELTGLLGLILIFPLLGHAAWHAYRAIRGRATQDGDAERMFTRPA